MILMHEIACYQLKCLIDCLGDILSSDGSTLYYSHYAKDFSLYVARFLDMFALLHFELMKNRGYFFILRETISLRIGNKFDAFKELGKSKVSHEKRNIERRNGIIFYQWYIIKIN